MNLQTFKGLLNIVIRGWGMLFRALFIASIGLIVFIWMDPLSIKDVPFAKLTMRKVVEFFSAAAIIVYCFVWFFDFPPRDGKKDPYGKWAMFSIVVILAATALWVWLQK